MASVNIEADNVTTAWLDALSAVLNMENHRALHTIVRITNPVAEISRPRQGLDKVLKELEWNTVETVANTIFPAQIARTSRSHAHLVERYTKLYPALRKRLRINAFGTYFGRLVAYPSPDRPFDQLAALIERIGVERKSPTTKNARYEAALTHPSDLIEAEFTLEEADRETLAASIYVPGYDNRPMGFPCLSHCSFQLTRDDRLHLLAHYRSQYMVERAYGNYLGLGRLQQYVATQAGIGTGQLTVVAGLAQIDPGATRKARKLLAEFT